MVQVPYVSWTLTLPNLDPSDWAKKGYDEKNPATTLQVDLGMASAVAVTTVKGRC